MGGQVLMPALSPTMENGNLSKWLKKEGDTVKSGDVIAEIETDKATMEVEAVDEGTLGKILVPAGTNDVAVNTPIAMILGDGEDASALKDGKPTPALQQKAAESAPPAEKPEPAKQAQAPAPAPADSSTTLSLEERALMASRIYNIISSFFPGLSQTEFDAGYSAYLREILRTSDRREFDLASMAFVAELHDGHSWFYDTWLDTHSGQPTGFLAFPLAGGQWTVVRSSLDQLKVGDVIECYRTEQVARTLESSAG